MARDGMMAALLVPDWPDEGWYRTVMAHQLKRYFYSGDREVLEDMPATGYGYWAVLIDTNMEPTGTLTTARKSGTSQQNAGGEGTSSRKLSVDNEDLQTSGPTLCPSVRQS